MTIKKFYEKYGDVELTEEQVKNIKECLNIKESKKWKPKKKEKYFYFDDRGIVDYSFFDDTLDNARLNINNCFKTEEDALFRLEQIKVYNELKNFADENNKEIDWESVNKYKYSLTFNFYKKIIDIVSVGGLLEIGQIYFSSHSLADQAITKIGADRIKKYLFGVE